jgi:hypothetical protein
MLRLFIKLFERTSTPAQQKEQNWNRYFSGEVEA